MIKCLIKDGQCIIRNRKIYNSSEIIEFNDNEINDVYKLKKQNIIDIIPNYSDNKDDLIKIDNDLKIDTNSIFRKTRGKK